MVQIEIPTTRQLQALVHSVLDEKPKLESEPGDLIEAVKWACARRKFAYDGARLTRLVDGVLFVRRSRALSWRGEQVSA